MQSASDDLEHVGHAGIIAVAQAGQRLVGRHVEPPVLDAIVAHMDADDLAEDDKVVLSLDLDHLGHAAFQAGRGGRHTGAVDLVAVRFFDASVAEFIRAMGQRRRGGVHRVAHRVFDNVHAEDAGLADVGHAVLGPVHIGFGPGRGKHHLRRRIGDPVEKRIGGQIVVPVRVSGGDPSDRAWGDNRVERVMGQGVAVLRAVEHQTLLMVCTYG